MTSPKYLRLFHTSGNRKRGREIKISLVITTKWVSTSSFTRRHNAYVYVDFIFTTLRNGGARVVLCLQFPTKSPIIILLVHF